MILPDLNLLLYAYNPHTPDHPRAHAWWQDVVNGSELIALPHEILFGFVRIATHPGLGMAAASLAATHEVVTSWLALPHARLLTPEPDHYQKVIDLMRMTNSRGRLLSDAILANYAITHRATLCSNDLDFARFPGLDFKNPLQSSA